VCEKLRIIYAKDIPWVKCSRYIGRQMYALKIRAMKFYADKTEIEVLQELSKYSTDDIKEMMSDEKCST
jgi:hypothetical protein